MNWSNYLLIGALVGFPLYYLYHRKDQESYAKEADAKKNLPQPPKDNVSVDPYATRK